MKRAFILSVGLISVTAFAAMNAPRFVKLGTARDDSKVEVSWREHGLGENQPIHYVVNAQGGATYFCFDKWNERPADTMVIRDTITAEADLTATAGGAISGKVVLEPPAPGDFKCASEETMMRGCVSFTGIELQDVSNSVTTSIGGTYVMTEPPAGRFCRDY